MNRSMNHIESSAVRNTPDREPVVHLSNEEKAVLTCVRKHTRRKRRKPLWKRLQGGSTLFYWWWCW